MNRERHVLRCAATVLSVALLSAVGMPAYPQQTPQFGVVGFGAESCAKFGKAYQLSPELAELNYFAWAQGFMSGANMEFMINKLQYTNLATWNVERQEQFIRQYCSDLPLVDFSTAAIQLFAAIRKDEGLMK